ncbi:MAG: PaaI family thioesterase [Bacteroidales bacterium]|nr:PaaI family thioesterase [Bacteroidales bacterium]
MTLKDKFNEGDKFAKSIGAQLTEVFEGYACAELTVGENHINIAGVCQAGVIYTLAEFTFAAVANCHGTLSLGIQNTITFIQSAKLGDKLLAECKEVINHKKLPYCDIRVTNQDGELIAAATGLGYRMKEDFEFDVLM